MALNNDVVVLHPVHVFLYLQRLRHTTLKFHQIEPPESELGSDGFEKDARAGVVDGVGDEDEEEVAEDCPADVEGEGGGGGGEGGGEAGDGGGCFLEDAGGGLVWGGGGDGG